MFDEIFGSLEQKYNFYKYENINIFGKEYNVKIVVENDEENSILEIQKENYKGYLNYINSNKVRMIDLIKQYLLDIYNENIDIKKDMRPISIYFSRDSSWGVLFDLNIDEENGFAVFIKDSELHIGTQDMFI